MHITLKLCKGLGNLRTVEGVNFFSRAAERAKRFGLRIIHFSLQSNHLHMLVEADNKNCLEHGMRSLNTTLAIAIKKLTAKAGEVFNGRYHLHKLKSPTETKHALRYVLFNYDHHCEQKPTIDVFSSAPLFAQARELTDVRLSGKPPSWIEAIARALSEPRSWLLSTGWKKSKA